jgi:hypothetical protein
LGGVRPPFLERTGHKVGVCQQPAPGARCPILTAIGPEKSTVPTALNSRGFIEARWLGANPPDRSRCEFASRRPLSTELRCDVMGIVEDLLTSPGLYVGTDTVAGSDLVGAARIQVSPLPGRAGVSLDYEILNGLAPGPILGHVEHTLIGRADDGTTVMVIAHTHGQGITILRETDPGVFEPGDVPVPYPMKVVVSVPKSGRLHHAWWYGPQGGQAVERDVAELEIVAP